MQDMNIVGTYPRQVGQDSSRCPSVSAWGSGSGFALFRRLELVAALVVAAATGVVAAVDRLEAVAVDDAAVSYTAATGSTCTRSSGAYTSHKAPRRRVCSSASACDSDRKLFG